MYIYITVLKLVSFKCKLSEYFFLDNSVFGVFFEMYWHSNNIGLTDSVLGRNIWLFDQLEQAEMFQKLVWKQLIFAIPFGYNKYLAQGHIGDNGATN